MKPCYIAFFACLCALFPPALSAADTPCVAVVGTNDLHGAIEPHAFEKDGIRLRHGGLLAASGYLKILRQQYPENLLLLDGGDIFQGTMASNLSEGEAIVAAYNALGYDGVAIGNHEFDFGPGQNGRQDERLAVLHARMRQAQFPFLGLNIYEKRNRRAVRWPNTSGAFIKDVGGVRVGVIGVATPDTPKVTLLQNVESLDFRPLTGLVLASARQLRAQGAQLVVLVGHIGGKCGKWWDPHDVSECRTESELWELLHTLPEGTLDVAIGGHTHQLMAHWIRGTAVIESGARGQYLGLVEACVGSRGIDKERSSIHPPIRICVDAWEDGTCSTSKARTPVQPATFRGEPVQPDPHLVNVLQPYLDSVTQAKATPQRVRLPYVLGREPTSKKERPLGEYVAESMRQLAKADVAVQNLGGVRADLPAGDITFGHIFEVLPFDNRLAVLTLTGQQLQHFVTHLVGRREGHPPYLAGMSASVTKDGVALQLEGGKKLDPAATYRVATNDFLALGGEGLGVVFDALSDSHREVWEEDLRTALVLYLQTVFPVN